MTMKRILLTLALLGLPALGQLSDFDLKFSVKSFSPQMVIEGKVQNLGSFHARSVTVEARGVDESGAAPKITWNQTVIVKDLTGGASRSFRLSVPAGTATTAECRVSRVER